MILFYMYVEAQFDGRLCSIYFALETSNISLRYAAFDVVVIEASGDLPIRTSLALVCASAPALSAPFIHSKASCFDDDAFGIPSFSSKKIYSNLGDIIQRISLRARAVSKRTIVDTIFFLWCLIDA